MCAAAGFLSYEDFQSQALGVGAAVSAVTLLFWVAVLLLVVSCCVLHCTACICLAAGTQHQRVSNCGSAINTIQACCQGG
jgi:hypothetical protein